MRRWLGRAALAWLAWRVLGPLVPPRFSVPQERPLRIQGRTVAVGERELFVREAGPANGPIVVLVHGWGADSLLNWYRVLPVLAERMRVLAIDQRDHGKSDRVREGYSIEGVADDLAWTLEALGIETAVVTGYSIGGMVAQSLALRHPHRVEALVLCATAARLPTRARWLRRMIFWVLRAAERLSGSEGAWLRYRYLLRAGAVEQRHARWLWETFMDRDPTLFYDAGFTALDFDSRDWARRLRQPALVLVSADDPLVPPHAQRDLAALLPDATLVELEGARHEASLTHSDEMAKAILGFVERLSGTAPRSGED